MLYYMVLFGGSVMVVLVVYWLYREAMNIRNDDKRSRRSGAKSKPTDHLKGVVTNTTINNGTVSWGGEGGLAPKHPARSQAAMPSSSSYWDLPENTKKPAGLHAYPDGSKTRSEFWNYLVTPDRPGHGTGIKPGHGTGINPGDGTGIRRDRSS